MITALRTRRRLRTTIAGVVLAVAGLVGATAMTGTAAASGTPATPTATPKPPPPPVLHVALRPTAVQRVHDLILQKFADADAGVTLEPDGTIVARVAGVAQQAVRSALNQSGLGATTVISAEHSLAQLKALGLRIGADAPNQHLTTPDIVQWGPDVASNKIVFYLHQYDPAVAQQLEARYGADWVQVSQQTRSWPHKTSDRYSDSPPFYGGDAIWVHGQPPATDCTSGFTTIGNNSGNDYMLTEGHCANVGDNIDTDFNTPYTMGPVTNQRYIDGGLDAETIGGTYGPWVWGGSGELAVIGSGDVPPNEGSYSLVTVNGAATGEHRGLPVIANDQCVYYPDDNINTCYLTIVSGFQAPGGDSGGPVYQYSSSGQPQVFAVGTIDGEGDSETFVQQIIDEETYFNVTIATAS